MSDAAQAGAWRVRGRWHRDHHPAVHLSHRRAGHRRRQLRYPLAREPSRQARRQGLERMTSIDDVMIEITPQVLLKAYAAGIFPMAESAEDNALYWIEPEQRGTIPLDGLIISRSLRKRVRRQEFEIQIDTAFPEVIAGCAARYPGRGSTWINSRIRSLYGQLFKMGCCHTVETWKDGQLVGGLYGVRIGAAFFGESMFSLSTDASKVALVHLVA